MFAVLTVSGSCGHPSIPVGSVIIKPGTLILSSNLEIPVPSVQLWGCCISSYPRAKYLIIPPKDKLTEISFLFRFLYREKCFILSFSFQGTDFIQTLFVTRALNKNLVSILSIMTSTSHLVLITEPSHEECTSGSLSCRHLQIIYKSVVANGRVQKKIKKCVIWI